MISSVKVGDVLENTNKARGKYIILILEIIEKANRNQYLIYKIRAYELTNTRRNWENKQNIFVLNNQCWNKIDNYDKDMINILYS